MLKALSKIKLTSLNKDEIKEDKIIKSKLEKFEIVFLIVLETKVLNATDAISKILQSKHEDIQNASKMFSALFENLKGFRDSFKDIKNEAINLALKWGTTTEFEEKCISRPKKRSDEISKYYAIEISEDRFRINTFYKTLDIAIDQVYSRSTSLRVICDCCRCLDKVLKQI
ncbi:unnamed protein product [Psylliodes chrysocephalus]|uniref:Uncharacterized protein n=1 Tax=Psylliodes chrysocephalus TaxID=3402493 RepID=A0A9P0D2Y3_9CUCU|nr:unnamed protein product [Psylliodes chrysocephala]